MPHCDPAPPHPDPGEISMALCPPGTTDLVMLVLVAALILAGVLIMSKWGPDAHEGGDE